MKTGKSLMQLAEEVQRQADSKRDYVASTKDIRLIADEDLDTRKPVVLLELGGKSGEVLKVGETAHDQIATIAGVPKAYYDRMLAEQPQLLAQNVNTWFTEKPVKRMVRTLDGKARALMSDKYRALDNYQLLEAALPALQSSNLDVVSMEVTEKRLYLKAVDRAIQRHIPAGFRMGDGSHQSFRVPNGEVIPAIQISNSEIGHGSLNVTGGWLDHGCTNLAWMFKERGLNKRHVGATIGIGDELYKLLSDETRAATDQAIWMQFRDAVKAAISVEGFDALVETLTEAAGDQMAGDPIKVVEVTAKEFGFNEGQRNSILRHLIQGGDLSKFGLANALTSAANEQEAYEAATDLEIAGGKIIELPKHEWKRISTAKVEMKEAA